MVKFTDLVANYKKWRDDKFLTHSKRDTAAVELANYVLTCNKFWNDLELLGRELIQADREVKVTPLGSERVEALVRLERAKDAFSALLDAQEAKESVNG